MSRRLVWWGWDVSFEIFFELLSPRFPTPDFLYSFIFRFSDMHYLLDLICLWVLSVMYCFIVLYLADIWLTQYLIVYDYFFILVRCIQYLDNTSFYWIFTFIDLFWYGDHSDRVTSDLVSISVIKSIYVLFCTIGGKLMGISESCRPLLFIYHFLFCLFCIVLCWICYVILCFLFFVMSSWFYFYIFGSVENLALSELWVILKYNYFTEGNILFQYMSFFHQNKHSYSY